MNLAVSLSLYCSLLCQLYICLSVYDSVEVDLSNHIEDYESVNLLRHHIWWQEKMLILFNGSFCAKSTSGIGVLSIRTKSATRFIFHKFCAGKYSNSNLYFQDSVPIGSDGLAIAYNLDHEEETDKVVWNVSSDNYGSFETSEYSDFEIGLDVVLFENTLISQFGLLLYKPLEENSEIIGLFRKSRAEWLLVEQFGSTHARLSKYLHPEGLVIPGPEITLYGKVSSVHFCGNIGYLVVQTQSFILISFDWDQFHSINEKILPDSGGSLKINCLNENLIVTGTELPVLRSINLNLEFESKGFYRATTNQFDTSVSNVAQLSMAELFPDLMLRVTFFTSCDINHYGKSCKSKCLCPGETGNCDYGERGTGQCLSCKQGWAGRLCDTPCLCPADATCLGGLKAPVGLDPNHICDCKEPTKTGPSCQDCRPGYYAFDQNIEKPCQLCPAGHFCKDGIRRPCPKGTISSNTGSSSCQECFNNTIPNNAGTSCVHHDKGPSMMQFLFDAITNFSI